VLFFCFTFALGNKIKNYSIMSNKKTKSIPKAKEPIKLRFKQLSGGNKSIYLDYYKNGKREYEFLKLYLIPETGTNDKEANNETLRLANAIKAQKIVELQNTVHGFSVSGGRSKTNLLTYVQNIADKKFAKAKAENRDLRSSGYQQIMALYRHIEQYSGTKTTFKQVDKQYCIGFLEYLKTTKNSNNTNVTLNENTQNLHVRQFQYILNCAVSDELTNLNPFKQIRPEDKPKKHKTEVCFLTIDEINTLIKTEYVFLPIMKQAFLFSCFSGLRFSDVKGLTWSKLQKDNSGNTFINYIQKKTKKQEYLPLAQKAIQFLPDRPSTANDNDFVFKIPSGGYVNLHLKQWAISAGIKKKLTFHVARHTNATLLLSLEVPIETVSKMLGHSDIQTTQIYAKVINKSMQAAANKLDSLIN
jgi:integrase